MTPDSPLYPSLSLELQTCTATYFQNPQTSCLHPEFISSPLAPSPGFPFLSDCTDFPPQLSSFWPLSQSANLQLCHCCREPLNQLSNPCTFLPIQPPLPVTFRTCLLLPGLSSSRPHSALGLSDVSKVDVCTLYLASAETPNSLPWLRGDLTLVCLSTFMSYDSRLKH